MPEYPKLFPELLHSQPWSETTRLSICARVYTGTRTRRLTHMSHSCPHTCSRGSGAFGTYSPTGDKGHWPTTGSLQLFPGEAAELTAKKLLTEEGDPARRALDSARGAALAVTLERGMCAEAELLLEASLAGARGALPGHWGRTGAKARSPRLGSHSPPPSVLDRKDGWDAGRKAVLRDPQRGDRR